MNLQESLERQLLGRLIADKNAYYENADIISVHLFEYYDNVFDAFLVAIKGGKHPTLSKMIKLCPKEPLVDMTKHVDYSVPVPEIISELEELYKCKLINEGCLQASIAGDSETKMAKLSEVLVGVTKNERSSFTSVYEIGKKIIEDMTREKSIEIDTGFRYLNALMGGFQRSDLVIIAAETSQGKTSLALNMADTVARGGIGVAIISLEMSEGQIVHRLVSSQTELDRHDMRKVQHYEAVQQGVSVFKNIPITVVDVKNTSITHILGLIRSSVMRFNIGLVVVDYLQLVSDKSHRSREQEVAQVSRALKNIAKELNICILLLSQLSRDKQNPYPTLSRLRDSGQIEEAADVVLFIYRAEQYGYKETADGTPTDGLAEIIMAKGRNYGTGKFECRFEKTITRFSDFSNRERIRDYSEPSRVDATLPNGTEKFSAQSPLPF